jgi:hypothetical protein
MESDGRKWRRWLPTNQTATILGFATAVGTSLWSQSEVSRGHRAEPSTVTKAVAANIAQASIGVRDTNARLTEAASAPQEVTNDVGVVKSTVGELIVGSELVQISAGRWSGLANERKQRAAHVRL